ncbi:MAG: lipoprotein [Robiginitomaculum sp.]|nr:lipoprotein [Robiginitomaculum sp.]
MINDNNSVSLAKTKILAFVAIVSLALAACGVRGAPEIPPPMWDDQDKEEQSQAE